MLHHKLKTFSYILLGFDMKRVFVIFKNGNYQEVSHEEYDAFDGEKFTAPPHWRMITVCEWLLSYRYI